MPCRSVLSRATTIIFLVKQATSRALRLVGRLQVMMQRLDIRHRREGGAQNRKTFKNGRVLLAYSRIK